MWLNFRLQPARCQEKHVRRRLALLHLAAFGEICEQTEYLLVIFRLHFDARRTAASSHGDWYLMTVKMSNEPLCSRHKVDIVKCSLCNFSKLTGKLVQSHVKVKVVDTVFA